MVSFPKHWFDWSFSLGNASPITTDMTTFVIHDMLWFTVVLDVHGCLVLLRNRWLSLRFLLRILRPLTPGSTLVCSGLSGWSSSPSRPAQVHPPHQVLRDLSHPLDYPSQVDFDPLDYRTWVWPLDYWTTNHLTNIFSYQNRGHVRVPGSYSRLVTKPRLEDPVPLRAYVRACVTCTGTCDTHCAHGQPDQTGRAHDRSSPECCPTVSCAVSLCLIYPYKSKTSFDWGW